MTSTCYFANIKSKGHWSWVFFILSNFPLSSTLFCNLHLEVNSLQCQNQKNCKQITHRSPVYDNRLHNYTLLSLMQYKHNIPVITVSTWSSTAQSTKPILIPFNSYYAHLLWYRTTSVIIHIKTEQKLTWHVLGNNHNAQTEQYVNTKQALLIQTLSGK
jgi:hypothetical protein